MKKFFILLFCSFLLAGNSFSQNLINDPGAESDPVANGWVIVSQGTNCYGTLNWRITGPQNGYPAPRTGSYYFFSGCGNINGELYQDVDVSLFAASIDALYQSFTFSGYMAVYNQSPSDSSRMIVEYRNSSSNILDTFDTKYRGDRTAWTLYTDKRKAPVGTRTIRIRLISKNLNGTSVDAYFDDLALMAGRVLPVTLSGFSANLQKDNSVRIQWQTASESNGAKFSIERSANSIEWFKVADVLGKGEQNGNDYSIVDQTPSKPISYYRLKQTDVDGQSTYSKVVSINIKSLRNLNIFPNPAKNVITISGLSDNEGVFKIFNFSGQDVTNVTSSNKIENGKITVDINRLPKGNYVIKTENSSFKFSKL